MLYKIYLTLCNGIYCSALKMTFVDVDMAFYQILLDFKTSSFNDHGLLIM